MCFVAVFIKQKRKNLNHIPALVDNFRVSSTVEVFNICPQRAVDEFPIRFAHMQEVWPETSNCILCNVCQGLAHGGTEDKATNGFVNTGKIAAERRLGHETAVIN